MPFLSHNQPCQSTEGTIRVSLQKIWKSHSILISTKIRLMKSASVAYSNIRLWKLDSQKEWRNTSWRLWDERTEKDSAGFVDSKENKWVGSQQSWSEEGTVRHRQSKKVSTLWSRHEETRELPGERDIMQGTTPGARRRGRAHTYWMDIKTWTGLSVEESIRMTEDRDKWRKYVHGMANPRIEDG